jgi:hypothetical protein
MSKTDTFVLVFIDVFAVCTLCVCLKSVAGGTADLRPTLSPDREPNCPVALLTVNRLLHNQVWNFLELNAAVRNG